MYVCAQWCLTPLRRVTGARLEQVCFRFMNHCCRECIDLLHTCGSQGARHWLHTRQSLTSVCTALGLADPWGHACVEGRVPSRRRSLWAGRFGSVGADMAAGCCPTEHLWCLPAAGGGSDRQFGSKRMSSDNANVHSRGGAAPSHRDRHVRRSFSTDRCACASTKLLHCLHADVNAPSWSARSSHAPPSWTHAT